MVRPDSMVSARKPARTAVADCPPAAPLVLGDLVSNYWSRILLAGDLSTARSDHHRLRVHDRTSIVLGLSLIAFSLYMLLSRRVEIRQKGLASSGMLYPWSKISPYAWDSNHAEFAVLHLRNSGPRVGWFPTPILVRRELRSQFDVALTRQLMKWPRPSG